jgi:hypothetical protein
LPEREVKFSGAYPGWKPNMDSAILKIMQDVYNKNFGKIPEIKQFTPVWNVEFLEEITLTGI